MATYTKRVQTVLTDDEYETLRRIATERDQPLSIIIRTAVEQVYFDRARKEQRQAALAELLALDAPVADWPVMEQEIISGATE